MTPGEPAFDLVSGFRAAQVVHAAAELGIPDLVARQPMTEAQLAAATGIDQGRLRRLLRGLVVLGVLAVSDDGRCSNTEVGELFREGVPGSRRAMVRMMIPENYAAWGHFMETLRTGTTGHQLAFGRTLWDSLRSDPEFAERFNRAMVVNSEAVADVVSTTGDFSSASLTVDVGGGKGGLAGGLLRRHTRLRAIVGDLPAGLAEAFAYLAGLGVADRTSLVECNFFEAVPDGGDVYLLKDILHDWDDQDAAAILSVCRRAMRRGARLMIVERVLPDRLRDDPAQASRIMTDLHMMVLLGGRERTQDEFRALFQGGGFELRRFEPGELFGLVEGVAS